VYRARPSECAGIMVYVEQRDHMHVGKVAFADAFACCCPRMGIVGCDTGFMRERTRKMQGVNQLAADIARRSTGTVPPATTSEVMRAMGRRGSLKCAAMLTPAQRERSAQRAAKARWEKRADSK